MLHLTDYEPASPALCGHQPDPADPDCIPLRWWNGNREGVCQECLRLADARRCTEANPCHPDREAHRIAAYLADTGRLRDGVTVHEVAEIVVRHRAETETAE